MVIRLAGIYDADALFQLNELFNGRGCTTIEKLKKSLEENRQEDIFIVCRENTAVGFCCVQRFVSMCYSLNYVEITELFIREEYRRRGAASALLRSIEEYYRDAGIGGYQLFTGKENYTAQRFYEKRGYKKSDELMYRKRL